MMQPVIELKTPLRRGFLFGKGTRYWAMQHSDDASADQSLSSALQHLLDGYAGRQLRLGELLERMGVRGFGFAYLVFGLLAAALPAVLCSLMSLPILLFSLQQMAGHARPAMPARFNGRHFPVDAVRIGLHRAGPWLNRLERFSRPRWQALAGPVANRMAAAMCAALSLIILIPGPFTNTPPGIVIALFGFAMASRDGLLMLLAVLASVVAVIVSLSALGAFFLAVYAWTRQALG